MLVLLQYEKWWRQIKHIMEKEMTTKEGKEYHEKIFERCNVLMNTIMECPIPVIAVVNGVAAAAGCQLVAMCDIAIATKSSR